MHAQAGFRSIVSNRPDREDADQPNWAEIERAAGEAGLKARHIPVTPGAIGESEVARFAAALDELPGPVLAFCRTGARSASLWALASAGKDSPEGIIRTAAEAGYDLSHLCERLTPR